MSRLNKSQFASLAGVSRAAIGKATTTGAVICINGKIDTDHPTNKAYLEIDRRQKKKENPAVVVKSEKPEPENKGDKSAKKKSGAGSGKIESAKISKSDYSSPAFLSKTDADIGRLVVVTAKEKVNLAQKIGTLILREQVAKLFGGLYSIIMNFFHPLGQRLAPIVAGICGVTDPVKILKIEKAIDKEIMRGLDEFKREAEKGVG